MTVRPCAIIRVGWGRGCLSARCLVATWRIFALCGYLMVLCPVAYRAWPLKRGAKLRFFFCIISPFREVFVPLLANCALIYLLHNSLKSKNIANFAPANALVAELVDAPDLGSGVSRRAGSSPVRRTNKNPNYLIISGWDFCFNIFAEFFRVIKRLPV